MATDDHGGLWRRVEAGLRHGIWLGCFVVLAGHLGPRDYGVLVLAAGGATIVEAGLRAVVARLARDGRRDGGRRPAGVATAAVAAGTAVSASLYLGAGAAAAMFDDPALADLIQTLAVLPLLGALAAAPEAALRRERRWRALAAASGAGAAAGGALALWLAGQGAGIWAPAAQLVVQRFGETAALWLAAGRRLPRAGGGRDAGAPGGRLDLAALAAALPAVARRGPALIVLGVLGPVAAGLFFVALRLGEALADIVAAPLRDGAARRLDPRLLLAAAVPAALGSAALLTAAVPALTAPRWWGVVAPARLLLPAAVPAVLIAWRKAALAAAGKRAAEARWQAAEAALCCAAAALAAPFGLEAAAAALLAAQVALAAAGAPVPVRGLRSVSFNPMRLGSAPR